RVGAVISYTYVVTNNSNTTSLAGPVTVTDDRAATVTCPPGAIAPLASVTCTATTTVTQADLDAGSITNTARARAGGTDSNEAEATVRAAPDPRLTVTKTASEPGPLSVPVTVHYTYVVRNLGNVTLTGIAWSDDNAAGMTCPQTSLAPRTSM